MNKGKVLRVFVRINLTFNLIYRKFIKSQEKNILFFLSIFPSFRTDMYAQDSIDLLLKSGIQFKRHEEEGIDPHLFAELLTTSGVVFMENVTWLSFHA